MEEEFVTPAGTVLIRIDDDEDYRATVTTIPGGNWVGDLRFQQVDEDERQPPRLKLVWAYLDRAGAEYLRKGIGARCLELVRAYSGLTVFAEENDGMPRSDGSHLTGDAPTFVLRMRDRGLIV